MRPSPPARKPTYRTFVAERHVAAPRDRLWQHLIATIDAGEAGPAAAGLAADDVLSFEPPWRRVARIDLAPAALAEHTVALRDDHDTCHLVWAYLVEPPEGGGDGAFDALLGRLADALRTSCDRVAAAVERG